MLNIVIGFDRDEPIAYHVLSHSILTRASGPVRITPLYLPQLRDNGYYWREHDPLQSTDFTYSRFLTPWFAGNSNFGIFMDSDMLCLSDIYELRAAIDYDADVSVVKHDYTPAPGPKFLGHPQTNYPCKNWSSLMVFNGQRMAVKHLTPAYVNSASASDLHQFKWADRIGSLPLEWNHLVGEYAPNPNAKLVHFTRGGPWIPQYTDCEYSDAWREECFSAMYSRKG